MDLRYSELSKDGFGITIIADKTLYSEQSEFQRVDIFESKSMGRVLTLDGLMMTTEKDEFFYHEMISHIPMCSHKNPETVLVIGGGDGGTIREVLKHDTVKKVVLCEIDGLVVESCKKYLPTIGCELDNPKVEVVIEDAIEYIKDKKSQYDIILIDSTDPMGPGEGLFTEEFYTNVKEALKPGGIMSAQSESPFINPKEMKMMYPLLRKVFPIVSTFVGPIPSYPGGYWSWAFCSVDVKPLEFIDEARADKISQTCKIYNKEYHPSCFALPNFVKELTK